jgi:hypothetical protein
MKASDVMSVDIIAGTENVSAIDVAATRIEYGGIEELQDMKTERHNCSKKYWC